MRTDYYMRGIVDAINSNSSYEIPLPRKVTVVWSFGIFESEIWVISRDARGIVLHSYLKSTETAPQDVWRFLNTKPFQIKKVILPSEVTQTLSSTKRPMIFTLKNIFGNGVETDQLKLRLKHSEKIKLANLYCYSMRADLSYCDSALTECSLASRSVDDVLKTEKYRHDKNSAVAESILMVTQAIYEDLV